MVTPKARLARYDQSCCGLMPSGLVRKCACTSIIPGIMVLPVTLITLVFSGIGRFLPMDTILLFSIRILPFSITSSPFMVMILAPVKAINPLGASLLSFKPIASPTLSG
ncbi:hypothetical protein D3C86_1555000 [compost metagenome]